MAHNCHGKRNNLAAQEKDSWQKEEPHRRKEKIHGKRKNLTAKTHHRESFPFAVGFFPRGYFFCRDSCEPP